MKKNEQKPHRDFRFQGRRLVDDALWDIAYSLVKEGKSFEQELGMFLLDWFDPSETISSPTSGSTGNPKSIDLPKAAMEASALLTGAHFGLGPKDKVLLCIPPRYIGGKMLCVRALILGLDFYFVEPKLALELPYGVRFDFVAMTPSQAESTPDIWNRSRHVLLGGAPVMQSLHGPMAQGTAVVHESYGMTETCSHVALRRLWPEPEPHFQGLPGVVFDQDERGCLVITAPELQIDGLVTNDVVERISDHAFDWLGRADHIINSGGVKVHPERVEAALAGFVPGRYFVTGIESASLGEKVVLVCQGPEGDAEALLTDIREGSELEKHEIPRDVYWIEEFTLTPNGKIDRRATMAALGTIS